MALTTEDIEIALEEIAARPELLERLFAAMCACYPWLCCPPGGGLQGGGGGGRGRRGPQGEQGPTGPVLNTYTFSTRQAAATGGNANYFFEFSGTATNFGATGARAGTIQDAANIQIGAVKLPTRAGFVSRMNVLFTQPRTIRAFVDINAVNIPISGSIAVPANIVTPIPITILAPWAEQDVVLVGITDQSEDADTLDMTAEAEITFTP